MVNAVIIEIKIITEEVIMPRGDKTGPGGLGPMTGRRMGTCVGNDQAGFSFRTFGRGFVNGFGRNLGRGFGRNHRFYQNQFRDRMGESQEVSKEIIENEIDTLKRRLSYLESELEGKN